MRDILNDLEDGKYLSDPDPVRRAQIQMKTHLPKRFYNAVSVVPADEKFAVHLDGKPVRTPAKALLALPTEKAASLVAGEFEAQEDVIDPVVMPVMRLVNTALDGVAADPQAVLEDILRFARQRHAVLPRGCAARACGQPERALGPGAGLGALGAWRSLQPCRRSGPCRAAAGIDRGAG